MLVDAAAVPADCVVVGHHDAAVIGQTELGSMALHVVQFVPGDVLVVPWVLPRRPTSTTWRRAMGGPMNQFLWCLAPGVAGVSAHVAAADRQEYNRRSAERYISMFRMNDVDADNVVSRGEARTSIELTARFDDIDINRAGCIT